MIINELKKITQAPSNGQLLAYTRRMVYFEPYQSVESVQNLLKNEDILEIHLFDTSKEYRSIASHKGPIEHLADFDVSDDTSVYKENMFIDMSEYKKRKLTVYNHIHYDDQNYGLIIIDDYRLTMGGSHE